MTSCAGACRQMHEAYSGLEALGRFTDLPERALGSSDQDDVVARQLFFPRPIPPSFSVLARAWLWYLGAQMWRVNLPRGVKSIPNPRLTPRILFPSWHRPWD